MSANVILHIGAAKTGSSAIQSFLKKNHLAFSKLGYVVPDSVLGLTQAVTGEHVWAFQERIAANDQDGLCARLAAAAKLAGDGKTLLISAENLSNMGNHRFLKKFAEAYDIKVVLYIRRQDDLLTSAWQQWHCKVEQDFQAWLLKGIRLYGHWDRLANDWETVAGPGKVSVRLFDRATMVGGDLLYDFVDALGLTSQAGSLSFDTGLVNPSFTDAITPLIAGNTNLFGDSNDNDFFHFLTRVGGQSFLSGKKVSLISKGQRESLVAYYDDVNQKVRQKHFSDRPRLFPQVDHSRYEYLDAEQLGQRQLRLLTELIFRLYREVDKK